MTSKTTCKMKARIKHTQQIIDVEWDIRGWIWDSPNGKRIFAEEELVFFDSDIDWQSFRNQAAKDILCATLSGGTASGMIGIVPEKETIVKASIEIADELIKQLKEKEDK